MKKWIDNIGGLGRAMIEIELAGQDYPILFVALIASKRFLVETLDYEDGIYLLSSVTERKLLNMLNGTKDIYTSISEGRKKYYVTYNEKVGEYEAKTLTSDDVSDDDMPDKNVFYTINTPMIDEYKQYLAKIIFDKSTKMNVDEVLSRQINIGGKGRHKAVYKGNMQRSALKRKRRVASIQFNNSNHMDNVCVMG